MGPEPRSRISNMYMVVAAVAPVFITSFFFGLVFAKLVTLDFYIYRLVIALSIAVGASGLITTLRHRGWKWAEWALATMAYCVIMFGVVTFVAFFIAIFCTGGL
jgi:hypothetical protein